MTPESTSSSEGSFIERSRALERRVEKTRWAAERQGDLIPDLASTINTDFASIAAHPASSDSQGFDFQGWFEGVYEEHRRLVREPAVHVREQRVQSASVSDGITLTLPEDVRARSWSHGEDTELLCVCQSLEFIAKTILAEMKVENRGKMFFRGKRLTSIFSFL